jgi:hypothetical protein
MARREHGRRKVAIATAALAFVAVLAGGATGAAMAADENSTGQNSTDQNSTTRDSGVDTGSQLQAPVAAPGASSGGQSDAVSGGS